MVRGRTSEERAKYREQIINKAKSFDLEITAYRNEHGINKDNCYHWFKTLRPKHPE